MKKRIYAALAGMVFLTFVYSGCAGASFETASKSQAPMEFTSSSSSSGANADGGFGYYDYTVEEEVEEDSAELPESGAAPKRTEERKIIRNAELTIETKEFDASLVHLEKKVEEYGGYIEQSYMDGNSIYGNSRRDANYTLRIPSENFDAFLNDAGGIGNVLHKNIGSEEITGQYFDTQARLESLRLQEERLLEILSKAEVLTDVIELEKALAEVRYEIESLTTTLRRYDGLIQYSTIHVYINEVYEITKVNEMPATLGERIGQEFSSSVASVRRSVENLVVTVVGGAPVILWSLFWVVLVVGVILLIVRVSVRSSRKAAAKRRQNLQQAPAQYMPGQGYGTPEHKDIDPSENQK